MKEQKYFYAIGRRKSSQVSVRLFEGKNPSLINDKEVNVIYKAQRHLDTIFKPLKILDLKDKYYFISKTKGGGFSSQSIALSLALARALVKIDPEYKTILRKASLISVDSIVKERKKPGLKKARKKEQYSKR